MEDYNLNEQDESFRLLNHRISPPAESSARFRNPRTVPHATFTLPPTVHHARMHAPGLLLSLRIGQPRQLGAAGAADIMDKPWISSFFRDEIIGPVRVLADTLEGDTVADTRVHGGPDKAICCYASEHYPWWREQLPQEMTAPFGAFGENFTTTGLAEDKLHVGDRFQIGSAIVMVRQPRMPCYKLAAKFQREDIVERFLLSGRSGVYFSVEQEGSVETGDAFELLERNHDGILISEVNRLLVQSRFQHDLLHKAVATAALPEQWRDLFSERLRRLAVAE